MKIKRSGKAYGDITVTDICREAEVSRGTFYLHYGNTAEVLDEVLDKALASTRPLEQQLYPQQCGGSRQCNYPLCQYIRNSTEYRCLFFDDALSPFILEKLYAQHREGLASMWSAASGFSEEQRRLLSFFQLSGCFAAAKRSENMSEADWQKVQALIDRFIRGGLNSLENS